jgi:hypothetical protein
MLLVVTEISNAPCIVRRLPFLPRLTLRSMLKGRGFSVFVVVEPATQYSTWNIYYNTCFARNIRSILTWRWNPEFHDCQVHSDNGLVWGVCVMVFPVEHPLSCDCGPMPLPALELRIAQQSRIARAELSISCAGRKL